MASEPSIVHEAVVVSTDPARGVVSVVVSDRDTDSCSSCAAAALCRHKGGEAIRVADSDPGRYSPGQRVRIGAGEGTHRRSVGLLLGLPCLMLALPLMGLLLLGLPEWVAFLAGIAGCALTYLALYAVRSRLTDGMTFRITG